MCFYTINPKFLFTLSWGDGNILLNHLIKQIFFLVSLLRHWRQKCKCGWTLWWKIYNSLMYAQADVSQIRCKHTIVFLTRDYNFKQVYTSFAFYPLNCFFFKFGYDAHLLQGCKLGLVVIRPVSTGKQIKKIFIIFSSLSEIYISVNSVWCRLSLRLYWEISVVSHPINQNLRRMTMTSEYFFTAKRGGSNDDWTRRMNRGG